MPGYTTRIKLTYMRMFTGPDGHGYAFDCAENGDPVLDSKDAVANWFAALRGAEKGTLVDKGLRTNRNLMKECGCGSGLWPEQLRDARGIFCTYTCDQCVDKEKAKYRPEIFEDSGYEADEPIEEDE